MAFFALWFLPFPKREIHRWVGALRLKGFRRFSSASSVTSQLRLGVTSSTVPPLCKTCSSSLKISNVCNTRSVACSLVHRDAEASCRNRSSTEHSSDLSTSNTKAEKVKEGLGAHNLYSNSCSVRRVTQIGRKDLAASNVMQYPRSPAVP